MTIETALQPPPTALESAALGFRARALEAYVAGDLTVAHDLFAEAVTIDPLYADAIADLAAAELERGNAGLAVRWARRALVLEPDHDAARFTLALAAQAAGEADEAARVLKALVADKEFASRNPELIHAARQRLYEIEGVDCPYDSGLQIVDPTRASFRHRFDILVKYLYALGRLGMLPAWCNVDVDSLYRRHIHLRTGGIEPGSERDKNSLEHYLHDFDQLIASMASDGFDPAHPVPLSSVDGLPHNGAHRIAAALAARCHIAAVHEDGPGGRWDEDWFRTHGFSREERNVLLRAWASIKKAHACVALLWSPVESAWPALEAEIDAAMPVVSRRTIELPAAAFAEFVRDVYTFDWGPRTGENIERKVGLLSAHPPRVRVLFVERPCDASEDLARTTKLALRERFAHLCPVDEFTTLHLSESERETEHLMRIVASENNLRWLRHRSVPRDTLVERLAEMHAAMLTRGVPAPQCCVVGGSVLDAFGLREADDVDFTLASIPREAHFDAGVTQLSETLDVVTRNYPRSFTDEPPLDDDQLIGNPSHHFIVRGIPFADPRIVLVRKQHQRRDKDLRDVTLLAEFLERSSGG